jgi:hypothetical protein
MKGKNKQVAQMKMKKKRNAEGIHNVHDFLLHKIYQILYVNTSFPAYVCMMVCLFLNFFGDCFGGHQHLCFRVLESGAEYLPI